MIQFLENVKRMEEEEEDEGEENKDPARFTMA